MWIINRTQNNTQRTIYSLDYPAHIVLNIQERAVINSYVTHPAFSDHILGYHAGETVLVRNNHFGPPIIVKPSITLLVRLAAVRRQV